MVYIYHPHIVTVRKVLNAFAAKDIDALASYFNLKARFWFSWMKNDYFNTFDDMKALLEKRFETQDSAKFVQQGYPDCVFLPKAIVMWFIRGGLLKERKRV